MTDAAIVYCTVGSTREATAMARTLVKERLVACANILGELTSVYHWEGAVQESSEVALLLKTSRDLVDRVIERVEELHSYDTPAIIAWRIAAGSPNFLQWIADQTLEADPAAGSAGG